MPYTGFALSMIFTISSFCVGLAGGVAHVEILKEPDGRSKGRGTVEFYHAEDCFRAIGKYCNIVLVSFIYFFFLAINNHRPLARRRGTCFIVKCLCF